MYFFKAVFEKSMNKFLFSNQLLFFLFILLQINFFLLYVFIKFVNRFLYTQVLTLKYYCSMFLFLFYFFLTDSLKDLILNLILYNQKFKLKTKKKKQKNFFLLHNVCVYVK